MNALIAAAFARTRTTILLLVLLFGAGAYSYVTIPKEAAPEIDIPIFNVTVTYAGINAEDSARLLVEPLERQLQSMQGLDRMSAQAGEGFAIVTLEFQPGFDQQTALQSVRDETDNATPDLPDGADAPVVQEIDLSLFPILTIGLSGEIPERELIALARDLEERLEAIPGVLEAELSGDREDLLEIIVNPLAIQSYGISTQEISQAVQNNNQLVAAGAFDTGVGRVGVSIPGTIQTIADVLAIPVRVEDGIVVRVQDVAEVRQTYLDPESFARINGQPTIGIDVRRTTGANVIETVRAVQEEVERASEGWPEGIGVTYLQNQAEDIETLLSDLENNVLLAILLVMLTMMLALGLRGSLLVAIAIPGAFAMGILVVNLLGFTLNIVVLFALILVIGMLVDGTIVVVELAERYRSEGQHRSESFRRAAQRMAWPIIAANSTTLAVFVPLLFWPGVAGQFMIYLPATVIATLGASLLMALIFVPVIGSLVGAGHPPRDPDGDTAVRPAFYDRIAAYTIARPGFALGLSLLVLVASFMIYGALGRGVVFFPQIDAERAQVQVRADGNLSVWEADRLVRAVESRIFGLPGVETVYARTIGAVEDRIGANVDPDVIGTIQVDFAHWRQRPPSNVIIERIRQETEPLPGIRVEVEAQQGTPGAAQPVEIEVAAEDRALLNETADRVQALMAELGTFVDVSSDVPPENVEIRLAVDREQAARYGIDMNTLGTTVQLLTRGVVLGTYLPDFAPDEVDIRLRYPAEDRTFAELANLRVSSPAGMVPISNFVTLVPGPAATIINRVNGRNVQTISAGVAEGTTAAEQIEALQQRLAQEDLPEDVEIVFVGEIEDQQETLEFLGIAFVLAIFLMFLILLTQLNSFFQASLVLSAIVFSIAGVLLGLVVRQEAFSAVMSGIGIVALAGIVVNNNIVLIDAYNEHRSSGMSPDEAAARAGAERFRPVMLTALTTIVGLMPMVLGMTVDFFGRDLYFGAPSGQFWVQLATAIVGGLLYATLITVLLTPSLLAWDGRRRERRRERQRQPEAPPVARAT